MTQIEHLREKLYKVIEAGDCNDILKTSQELDELILHYMTIQLYSNKQTA